MLTRPLALGRPSGWVCDVSVVSKTTPRVRSASYDGTARCHLYRGNPATVRLDKAVTVSGTKGMSSSPGRQLRADSGFDHR